MVNKFVYYINTKNLNSKEVVRNFFFMNATIQYVENDMSKIVVRLYCHEHNNLVQMVKRLDQVVKFNKFKELGQQHLGRLIS